MTYLLGYGCFLLGAILHLLGKIQEFKQMAKANPDPKIVYNTKNMLSEESVNIARMLIGGIALVIFAPMLMGGATVDIKNTAGQLVTTLSVEAMLLPFYFVTGIGGNSTLFAYFGKYKKTLMNQVGVEDENNKN